MSVIRRICVFCGSSTGTNPAFAEAAREMGAYLAREGIGLVYGGGAVGLMGIVADAVLAGGGEVVGVIPRALATKEIAHAGLTELHVVASMHERKALMAERSDAFLALPGGFGTLEELFEVVTWAQLGFHPKPCGVLNVAGYYDHLLTFLDHSVAQGLLKPVHREMLLLAGTPNEAIQRFRAYVAPPVPKWIRSGEE